jgi:hypothetical protein
MTTPVEPPYSRKKVHQGAIESLWLQMGPFTLYLNHLNKFIYGLHDNQRVVAYLKGSSSIQTSVSNGPFDRVVLHRDRKQVSRLAPLCSTCSAYQEGYVVEGQSFTQSKVRHR